MVKGIPEAFASALSAADPVGGDWGRIESQLEDFRSLPEDWDGYGATPPPAVIIDFGRRMLRALLEDGLPCPGCVGPGPNGTVSMEWERGGEWFEVELVAPTVGEWTHLTSDGAGKYTGPSCVPFVLRP